MLLPLLSLEIVSMATSAYAGRLPAGYDAAVAERLLRIDAIAKCDTDQIKAWTCKTCGSVPGFRTVATFSSSMPFRVMAYVGLDDALGQIAISFRSTVLSDPTNLVLDAASILPISLGIPSRPEFKSGAGFVIAVDQLLRQMRPMLDVLFYNESYADRGIVFSGHSLGGALATVAAAKLLYDKPALSERATLLTLASPRACNRALCNAIESMLRDNAVRVTHYHDPVVHLPPLPPFSFLYTRDTLRHFGHERWYATRDYTAGQQPRYCATGDDRACSAGVRNVLDMPWSDHIHYFGINVEEAC
jgi:hypothetical protein